MPDMPKGFITRFIAFLAGMVVISVIVHIANLSPDGGGAVELLCLLCGAVYLAKFLLDHEDEIPRRSDQP
ncbi:MAG TPA: hypothetical protein VFM94_02030 [Solirubrobacterales bacterium]|nr:hypothetical protein [Solirubrobacterales bacterium]